MTELTEINRESWQWKLANRIFYVQDFSSVMEIYQHIMAKTWNPPDGVALAEMVVKFDDGPPFLHDWIPIVEAARALISKAKGE